jgi:hypothetical protein
MSPGQRPSAGPALTGPVIGTDRTERFRAAERRIRVVSRIMDDLVEVPGTGRRVGLDPVLGLIPVLGDGISAAVGFWLIAEAARFRLPPIVLARMVVNTVVDVVIGAIPFVGDLFDFVSKSNARNLELFRRHATDPGTSTTEHRAFFAGLLLILVAIVWLAWQALGWLLSTEISLPF